MSTQRRRSANSSSSSSSSAKRPAAENASKVAAGPPQQPKKRAALGNLTNQGKAGNQVPSASTTSKLKKGSSAAVGDTRLHRNSSLIPSIVKPTRPTSATSLKHSSLPRNDGPISTVVSLHAPLNTSASLSSNEGTIFIPPLPAPCGTNLSPDRSDEGSVSMDETMSTCHSLKSPDIEYVDNVDASAVASLERRTCNKLYISEHVAAEQEDIWKSDMGMESGDNEIVNIDANHKDPQLCATIACDIYKHLRISETKKRPSTDFMEVVQKDITASMRAILVDWLVEVAEEYRLVPDTLYLAVNYIDRYLSENAVDRQQLQLLGVAGMLIASKYEEICPPQVEEFCYITDNTYFKDEVLQMEAAVLNHLKFEMTAPTTKCFLRRFVRIAQGSNEVPLLQLEFLASYVAELSLLEYSFLCFLPSLIAASAIFLANFILAPSRKPWNATLMHYTRYQPSELRMCVKELHRILNNHNISLPAVREKYNQHKYKFVAKKHCPPMIPPEYFLDPIN